MGVPHRSHSLRNFASSLQSPIIGYTLHRPVHAVVCTTCQHCSVLSPPKFLCSCSEHASLHPEWDKRFPRWHETGDSASSMHCSLIVTNTRTYIGLLFMHGGPLRCHSLRKTETYSCSLQLASLYRSLTLHGLCSGTHNMSALYQVLCSCMQ